MRSGHLKLLSENNRMIVGIVGALFIVGIMVAMLVSIMNCNTISFVQTLKYGSLWTLFPSAVFMITRDTWITVLSVWIPTFFLINQMDQSVCAQISGKPKKKLLAGAKEPTWSFSISDYIPETLSLAISSDAVNNGDNRV
jgi:hypothetical protein